MLKITWESLWHSLIKEGLKERSSMALGKKNLSKNLDKHLGQLDLTKLCPAKTDWLQFFGWLI